METPVIERVYIVVDNETGANLCYYRRDLRRWIRDECLFGAWLPARSSPFIRWAAPLGVRDVFLRRRPARISSRRAVDKVRAQITHRRES